MVAGPLDSESLHAAAESVGVEVEDLCGSPTALDDPLRSIENLQDVTAFDIFECR